MKEIQLTQGQIALVDDEDYELVSQYKWRFHKNGNTYYAKATTSRKLGKQKTIMMHRLIMEAKQQQKVDHINGDGLDNRKENLRFATTSENAMNKCSTKNKSSSYKGVSWYKRYKKWQAQIKFKGKSIYIGIFDTEIEAAQAYDNKAKELFGEFAKLNNINN